MRLASPASLAVLPVAAALLAGCGGDGGGASGSGADPASVMPRDAAVYLEAVVRPEGDQADQLESFLGKVMRTDDPGAKIKAQIDRAIQDQDPSKSYDADVAPWLGERMGVGVTNLAADEPGYIVAVETKDAGKAKAFVAAEAKDEGDQAGSYEDVDYFTDEDGAVSGVVGDLVVVAGSVADFKRAVDTPDDGGLDDAEAFDDATGDLPDDRLGTMYVDPERFTAAAVAAAEDQASAGVIRNVLASVTGLTGFAQATDDTATMETRTELSDEGTGADLAELGAGTAPDLLKSLPGDAWAAAAVGDVGGAFETGLESAAGGIGSAVVRQQFRQATGLDLDRDVLRWIGDVAFFARGDSAAQIGGGLVIQASDEDAAAAALPRLLATASNAGLAFQDLQMADADQAWAATVPGAPGPLVVARAGERVVVALGDDAAADALKPAETLEDSGLYDRAASALDGLDPTVVLDGPTMVGLIAENAGGDPDFQKAEPYLDTLDLVTAGASKDGDTLRQRFTVKVK